MPELATIRDTISGQTTEIRSDVLEAQWRQARQHLADQSKSWFERFEAINHDIDRIDPSELPQHLRCPIPECYRRTVVGALHDDDEPGFEAVLSHWRIDCATPIHGHPSVVMYRAISGRYRMTLYQGHGDELEVVKVVEVGPGEWMHYVGEGEHFEHFIHSVDCIEEGWTLNLYSDDATKGRRYGS